MKKGHVTNQISFKINLKLRERIDSEVDLSKCTQAEFLNDAVKFYLDYLENKRLELWRMEKEKSGDVAGTASETAKTGLGGGR